MRVRRVQLSSGLRLALGETGSGIPILLAHAWGETHRTFDKLAPVLASHLRLVVPDQRGVGASDKPIDGYSLGQSAADLVELLDVLALPSVFVLGTSSGGYVAQRLCVDYPERVAGLVLVGSPRSLAGAADPFGTMLAKFHDPVTPEDVRSVNGAISLRQPVPASFLADQDRAALSIPRQVWRARYEGLRTAIPPLDTGPVTAPTLLLWGDNDDVLPRSQADALIAEIPDARLVVYQDTGHLVLWEQPERVASDVLSFVEQVTSAD